MTLEEFRASRKTMTTRAFGDLVQDAQWEDDDPVNADGSFPRSAGLKIPSFGHR